MLYYSWRWFLICTFFEHLFYFCRWMIGVFGGFEIHVCIQEPETCFCECSLWFLCYKVNFSRIMLKRLFLFTGLKGAKIWSTFTLVAKWTLHLNYFYGMCFQILALAVKCRVNMEGFVKCFFQTIAISCLLKVTNLSGSSFSCSGLNEQSAIFLRWLLYTCHPHAYQIAIKKAGMSNLNIKLQANTAEQ